MDKHGIEAEGVCHCCPHEHGIGAESVNVIDFLLYFIVFFNLIVFLQVTEDKCSPFFAFEVKKDMHLAPAVRVEIADRPGFYQTLDDLMATQVREDCNIAISQIHDFASDLLESRS